MPTDSAVTRPTAHHGSFKFKTPDGTREIVAQSSPGVSGAWLEVAGKQLCLCSQGTVGDYVGVYDPAVKGADVVAIGLDPDGAMNIQIVLPGEGDLDSRYRSFSYDRLVDLIRRAESLPS